MKREITTQERELITWLLERCNTDSSKFMSQIDSLTVVSKCTCGCPTVYFSVDGNEPSREAEIILADYFGTVDAHPVGVMLFQRGGYLSSLEVYSCEGTDQPFGLPKIDTLYPLEDTK